MTRMTTAANFTLTHADEQLMLNASLRLLTTFAVLDEQTRTLAYHDYIIERYPEFRQLLLQLAGGEKASVAFANIDAAIINDLDSKHIVELDQIHTDTPIVIALAKNVIVNLSIFVRFNDEPSKRDHIAIAEHPTAVSWLLNATAPNTFNCTEPVADDIELLQQKGALVSSQSPAIVHYPNPNHAIQHWQDHIATADQLYLQKAGEALPEKVSSMLGRQALELPDSDIVWTCDAGTRLLNATVIPSDAMAGVEFSKDARTVIPSVKKHRQNWKQAIQLAKIGFKRNAYAQLDNIIPPAFQPALCEHVRNLTTHNYFGPLDDGQVARRMGLHNEAVTSSLHHRLAKLVSLVVGKEVKASYAYLGCYLDGAVLERHIDRPQCQYNLSIVFDMSDEQGEPVDPWPIYLQMGKKPLAVNLQPGSGLLYQGTKIEHWRDALPAGQRAIVCFYHFVEPNFDGQLI